MSLLKINLVLIFGLFLLVGFIAGCAGNLNNKVPAQDLQVQWKISPERQLYANEGFNVCLLMTYAGEQEFVGGLTLTDNLNYEQFTGILDGGVKEAFSSCPATGVSYKNLDFNQVQLFASVKIEKQETGVSGKFCIPSGTSGGGCPARASVPIDTSSVKSINVEVSKNIEGGNRVDVTIPVQENCELINYRNVLDEDGEKEISVEDISVRLGQSGVPLTCYIDKEAGDKKRKTLICNGVLDSGENYDESVGLSLHYGCEYKLDKVINFKKQQFVE